MTSPASLRKVFSMGEARFLACVAWVCGVLFGYGLGALLW